MEAEMTKKDIIPLISLALFAGYYFIIRDHEIHVMLFWVIIVLYAIWFELRKK
jgi:hypothetical protein